VICFGPDVLVVGVEVRGLESVEAASSLVGDFESVEADVFGRRDIRKPISKLDHSLRSYH